MCAISPQASGAVLCIYPVMSNNIPTNQLYQINKILYNIRPKKIRPRNRGEVFFVNVCQLHRLIVTDHPPPHPLCNQNPGNSPDIETIRYLKLGTSLRNIF